MTDYGVQDFLVGFAVQVASVLSKHTPPPPLSSSRATVIEPPAHDQRGELRHEPPDERALNGVFVLRYFWDVKRSK